MDSADESEPTVTQEEVVNALKVANEPCKSSTIAKALVEQSHCSECGKATDEFIDVKGQVDDHLVNLHDRGRLGINVDWKYYIVEE